MQKKIKVLIVGLGKIGMIYDLDKNSDDFYLSHVRSFIKHNDFELVGSFDPDDQKRKTFNELYKIKSYENLTRALTVTKPELVVISSPTNYHYQNLSEIVKCSSIKVVLCEKPLSYDINEANKMINLCKIRNIKLFINFFRRADPGVLEIKKMIQKKIIKPPIKGFCWYTKGMIHTASHFVDICYFWLGEIKSYKLINQGNTLFGDDPEPSFFIEFEKGEILFQSGWDNQFSHYTIELLSQKGRLRYENSGLDIYWQGIIDDPDFKGYSILNNKKMKIRNDLNRYQLNVTNLIAKYFQNETIDLTYDAEAYKILEILNKLKDSIDK